MSKQKNMYWLGGLAGGAVVVAALVARTPLAESTAGDVEQAVEGSAAAPHEWWDPGEGRVFPERLAYANPHGALALVNADGPLDTAGHPFFEPLSENGRACVTCHQPADGMSLSMDSIQRQWQETDGTDPLFAAIDGMDCPNLEPGDPESHSLLLERGLFRIFLPWPPKAPDGGVIEPEFTLEVVRDPTGCNTHPEYGLESEEPQVSVYRRPRPVANMRYVVTDNFGVGPFIGKNGMPAARDPETGEPVNMNLMSDAREATVRTQAHGAGRSHLQMDRELSREELDRIESFERQLYAAQDHHQDAGDLGEEGGPPGLGVDAMVNGEDGVLGNNVTRFVFPIGEDWYDLPRGDDEDSNRMNAFRESVARGHDVFFYRTFWIRDAMHLNSVGLGNPVKRTCSTCHGAHLTGMDAANGWMDIGTTNLPWAKEEPRNPWNDREPALPLFKITCHDEADAHPFLGSEIYTQDPGRALISGRCEDVGAIVMQQMRGLAARAPYFSNGAAADLRELVDFYDRRFNIGYTSREKEDLINFLSTL